MQSPKILPVTLYPHPVLRQPAATVTQVNDAIRSTLSNMVATLRAAQGIGLAAPQVNISQRLVVIQPEVEGEPDQRKPKYTLPPLLMVNPTLVSHSPERVESEEGCLSFPNLYGTLTRHQWVKVEYLDENETPKTIEAQGLLGRCLQHEIDHLDGILFFDHLSRLKRDMLLKKYHKAYPTIEDETDYPIQK
jgi:peptide deformylase